MDKILLVVILLMTLGCSLNKANKKILPVEEKITAQEEITLPRVWGQTSKDLVPDEKPRPAKHIQPDFSQMDPNIKSARVVLEAEIFVDGTVGQINVIESGGEYMDAQVIKAIRLWEFHPGKIKGEAVDCWVTFPIGYQIDN
ncbi:MAG: TonB family protein [Candidatus Cloacimonadales bacterium]|nr:TonB family protein [Candidatus Cloacimonadales bacterium]